MRLTYAIATGSGQGKSSPYSWGNAAISLVMTSPGLISLHGHQIETKRGCSWLSSIGFSRPGGPGYASVTTWLISQAGVHCVAVGSQAANGHSRIEITDKHSLRQSYFSWTAIWWAATVTDHGDVFGWSTHAFRKVDMRAQCMCLWSTLQMCATVLLWRYMWVTTAVLKLHLVSSVWEHLLCAQFDKMIGTKMWHFLGETYLVLAYERVTAQT